MAPRRKKAEPQYWVPPMHRKQFEIFNSGIASDASRFPDFPLALLVSGSRYSGKTIATLHRICRHLYETPGARVAMFAKYMKNLTDGGSFTDLVYTILPQWIAGCPGFNYLTTDRAGMPGPKTDQKTRTIYFQVTNAHGGASELRLFSLNNDGEVEARLKQMRFSMIYFSELSTFANPAILRASIWQLRMMHLKPWQHMFIADTNPSEEGEDSWIYQYWYQHRMGKQESDFVRSMRLIEVFLEDNDFLTDAQIRFYKEMYDGDPDAYARDIEGKWVKSKGTLGKHFAELYTPAFHMIGGGEGESDEIEILPTTTTLYTGWDLGSGTNHAAVILEKRLTNIGGRDISVWCVVDELVSLNERINIAQFTEQFHEKMKNIQAHYKRSFEWIHWSDDTALNVPRNSGAGFDALEVEIASKGEIRLLGVDKAKGSVRNRVKILRRLLRERRFYHAAKCEKTKTCLEECRQGTRESEFVAWNEHKHVFDAITYPMLMESRDELIDEAFKPQAKEKTESPMLKVALLPALA